MRISKEVCKACGNRTLHPVRYNSKHKHQLAPWLRDVLQLNPQIPTLEVLAQESGLRKSTLWSLGLPRRRPVSGHPKRFRLAPPSQPSLETTQKIADAVGVPLAEIQDLLRRRTHGEAQASAEAHTAR